MKIRIYIKRKTAGRRLTYKDDDGNPIARHVFADKARVCEDYWKK